MKKSLAVLSLAVFSFAFVFGVMLPLECLPAGERLAMESADLTVIYEAPFAQWARTVHEIHPRTKQDLEQSLGWQLISKPMVILVGDREAFEQMSGSPHISAFALPERHIIVMGRSIIGSEPYLFNVTYKHELCHLLLHDHIEESLLPKWLDEGVCQWVSGSMGEVLLSPLSSAAGQVDLSRHAVPLQRLAHSFPHGKHQLLLAYEESRSFVEYLSTRFGSLALIKVLNGLKEGNDIHRAVHMSLSASLDSIEEEWLSSLRKRTVWLIWLAQYLYEIIFILAALLTVAASIKIMIRKRNYPTEDDEDDKDDKDDKEP